jgi:hypothetical protein
MKEIIIDNKKYTLVSPYRGGYHCIEIDNLVSKKPHRMVVDIDTFLKVLKLFGEIK